MGLVSVKANQRPLKNIRSTQQPPKEVVVLVRRTGGAGLREEDRAAQGHGGGSGALLRDTQGAETKPHVSSPSKCGVLMGTTTD